MTKSFSPTLKNLYSFHPNLPFINRKKTWLWISIALWHWAELSFVQRDHHLFELPESQQLVLIHRLILLLHTGPRQLWQLELLHHRQLYWYNNNGSNKDNVGSKYWQK